MLILFFQSALGIWDFTIYKNFVLGPKWGEFFHLLFILLNMVLLVNLIIAILSETYQRLSYQKLGLYYDGVIEVIPAYKYKKFYGSLIAACPPFNFLVMPFLPFFAFADKKSKVRRLNNILIRVIYFPFALIYAVIFSVVNILLLPVAYAVTTYRKASLIFVRELNKTRRELVLNFLLFLAAGWILLGISQVVDAYYFFLQLYCFRTGEISSDYVSIISPEGFNTLEAVVLREVKTLRTKNPRDPLQMKTQTLIKILRDELEIITCV